MEDLERYSDNLLFNTRPLGPIGQSSSATPYVIALIFSKFLRVFGLFVAYEQLKVLHITQFFFVVKLCSSLVFVVLQRPVSTGRRITPNQWYKVGRHALVSTIISLMWLEGLSQCGALRAILLFEHSDLVVLAALGVLFNSGVPGPTKVRGSVLFLLGIFSLLLFDNDSSGRTVPGGTLSTEHHPTSQLVHVYYLLLSWLGLPDHKGGLILLLLALLCHVAHRSFSRKLAVEIGGNKRLTALSSCVSSVILLPLALISYFTQNTTPDWVTAALPMTLVILLVFVFDFYIESFSVAKLEVHRAGKIGSIASFLSALVFASLWDRPWAFTMHEWHHGTPGGDAHVLSGGTVSCALLFVFATRLLSRPATHQATKGNLIGYTTGGLPIYNFQTPQSVLTMFQGLVRQILEEPESRQIFYFLCLNLIFTGVELLYGVWTNSLGLISDGFHMLFDCTALVLGLCAALMSRWKANKTFSFGYGRVEILSGYVNGIFLVVISFFVFVAAIQRLIDPPTVSTERLLAVSVGGLLVNLVGILAFRHAHTHGGASSCQSHGHGQSHGHSHAHGHGHQDPGHSDRSVNMQGVFLHVLADTLGSVGVIVSSILIEQFGLFIADPVCSLFIAVLIFLSVIPLLRDSSLILLQRTPVDVEKSLSYILNKVLSLDGILSYRDQHVWKHSSDITAGTIHVQVAPSASEQRIIQQVTSLFKEYGINKLSVQVEKEAFFHHMSALSVGYKSVLSLKHGGEIGHPPPNLDYGIIKAV